MSTRKKRDPSLPVYLLCPTCSGTGYRRVVIHDSLCHGGACPCSRTDSRDCNNPLCSDGDVLCARCKEEGRKPRVMNPGVNFTDAVLATRYEGDEAVCEAHFTIFEEIKIGAGA